jgi:hypothetical protein
VLEIQFSSRSDREPSGSSEVSSKLEGFSANELVLLCLGLRAGRRDEIKTRTFEAKKTFE